MSNEQTMISLLKYNSELRKTVKAVLDDSESLSLDSELDKHKLLEKLVRALYIENLDSYVGKEVDLAKTKSIDLFEIVLEEEN